MAMSRKVETVTQEDFDLTKKNRDNPYSVTAFKTEV
jgi:hypothetical protein